MTADTDRVLVFNCGSSSLKYRLLEPRTGRVLATGMVDRIGEAGGHTVHSSERHQHTVDRSFADHAEALDAVLAAFAEHGPDTEQGLVAVGHRVVHGGRRFSRPIRVDDEVLAAIDQLSSLAPLHNPAGATGIRAARKLLPHLPHIAVFDTAFHRTIPARAATYAVPYRWRTEYGVHRYGFHGPSHAYVSRAAARFLRRCRGW